MARRPLTLEQIAEIVKRYRPRGWRIRQSHHRWVWRTALVVWETKTIHVPTLKDEESLFIFMHEVGHITHGHFRMGLSSHREEFEAERFAIHIFRTEGIPVTQSIMNLARLRIQEWIKRDLKEDVVIQPHIARWAKYGTKLPDAFARDTR